MVPVFIMNMYSMFTLSSCPSFCFILSSKPCDSGFNKQRQVQTLSVKSFLTRSLEAIAGSFVLGCS